MKDTLNVQWLTNENGLTNDAINWAQKFGDFLAKDKRSNNPNQRRPEKNKLSTTQLRRFFAEIKRLQIEFNARSGENSFDEKFKNEVLLIKPKLAYAKGRDLKGGRSQSKIDEFHHEITRAINEVKDKVSFLNFVKLVEATVAYHKAHGGE